METEKERLQIDYYESSDGHIIILVSKTESSIELLRDIVKQLVAEDQLEIDLGAEPGIELLGLTSFVLMSNDLKDKTFEQSVFIKRVRGKDEPQAGWVKSRERWKDTLELIDGLIASGGGKHQYLEEPFSEDAVIELSYKEEGVGRSG